MTPKEKAKKLVGKYYVNIPLRNCDNRRPHKMALIAVDEILNEYWTHNTERRDWWKKVKQEIEKL